MNEYESTPPQAAYDAVNTIRSRAGMPDFPANMTQEAFRKKLRNERSVELAFEDHRFWNDNCYLYAIDQKEVNKGYLIQNPGW